MVADLFTELPEHLEGNPGLAPWREQLNESLKHKMFPRNRSHILSEEDEHELFA